MTAKQLKGWEHTLMMNTRAFVWKALVDLPLETREQVFARVYATMHTTLALFHDKEEK